MTGIVKCVTFLNLQVGKAEFLGRAIGKPHVNLCEDNYKTPILEWFQIFRGPEEAGKNALPTAQVKPAEGKLILKYLQNWS